MTRDPRLTLNARQQELLEWVQRDGFVTVDDLAAHFDVTPQTIRRDVNWLADMNLRRRESADQFRKRLVQRAAADVP
jgi:DeoR family glycerol-3-phosphate regulon repressor